MSVTYNATLTMREETVWYLSRLLHHERVRRGTRTGSRALGCFKQAVLVIRWFLDGTRVMQLADDNAIGRSTCYDYLHEGIDVLASQAPELSYALQAAKTAGRASPVRWCVERRRPRLRRLRVDRCGSVCW